MVFQQQFSENEKFVICTDDLRVEIADLGATVTGIAFRGRPVLLGYETAEEYLTGSAYLGALVGRYANRIAGAAFCLNGKRYALLKNEGENQLHGGPNAFDKRRWQAEILEENSVRFTLCSPDGDNGFPGNLTASVTYSVSGGTLRLDFEGDSDADTVFAPTSHMYFNLDGAENILGTRMCINCSGYLEVGEGLIPTGRICPPEGEFDFSVLRPLGRDFDHCFPLRGEDACTAMAGDVELRIKTDFPAIQLYTGGALGAPFGPNRGFAIEPEFYPDSPNHPEFPSPVLRAGEHFHKYVEYSFQKQRMNMIIKSGFLVTGMPVNTAGRHYYGVDTGAWPEGISGKALRDEAEKGYEDLSYPVLLDKDNAAQYYVNCTENHIPVRLLFCHCGVEASGFTAQGLPHTLRLKELGYDYAYPSGDYFSSILNEVLYGKSKLAIEWGECLNQYGLLASAADVSAYIKRREQLTQESGEDPTCFEKGSFVVFHLFEVNLL